MIKEDLVSFDVAILLKEKGFSDGCEHEYDISTKEILRISAPSLICNSPGADVDYIAAPTLQMAMRWLRDIHKLHITAPLTYGSPRLYEVKIMRTDVCEDVVLCPEKDFDKPEEAYEAAIRYCIEYLI